MENEDEETQEEVAEEEEDEIDPAKYESSAFARPRTKGIFKWDNNPLEDRHTDYA